MRSNGGIHHHAANLKPVPLLATSKEGTATIAMEALLTRGREIPLDSSDSHCPQEWGVFIYQVVGYTSDDIVVRRAALALGSSEFGEWETFPATEATGGDRERASVWGQAERIVDVVDVVVARDGMPTSSYYQSD
ncbi:hypothetical protein N7539_007909 [Penicillium diatomitis]|uniref:Uncharacterized protein n=1 Tax=Penicillium diatomitis TaxID=2819901 RepID=A0A9W9WU91_9EURO|nr:uncharacterized protein N7539_007909 [Penicillium diatomitis]KAJ5475622.1 hypothetical protein N7539_007909 [Penicillium diatomitis]